ncbi:DUF881 domain-containing protein [Spirilliplanes yamanashiensis]|uniref:DUF881 domain-containing protein n=1 Tax=Spirilliplanes yamanashiensis TaxID=42233 RepID=UPI00194E190E|nr:DUF881 domain-containing protein [Spirilliplanes yamanashiensis]MDP9815023.1 uncharacterized protein YlxW (UPF0749 family) [Spirilliplanes yamanashiensis]
MDYTSGTQSWRLVLTRAVTGLLRRRRGKRQAGWSIGVPLIALAAGLLFTTTATTARGTALRDDRRPELTQLIADQRTRIADREARADALQAAVEAQTGALADVDGPVRAARRQADAGRTAAGLTALRGPGLTVQLDDSPRRTTADDVDGPRPDDLVVHQQDVQSVVNAMWAGGAEAMSIMGIRVISTSAVRCVGNTLLLHGQPFSPPFTIRAIGDSDAMQASLAGSAGVQQFRDAVADFGLGYRETVEGDVTVPAYDGSTGLRSAQVPG